MPVSDQWGSTKPSYVLTMIEGASDSSLVELGNHLGFELTQPGIPKIEPSFWEKGKFKLFISHLATHRQWAGELQEQLRQYGISPCCPGCQPKLLKEWMIAASLVPGNSGSPIFYVPVGFPGLSMSNQRAFLLVFSQFLSPAQMWRVWLPCNFFLMDLRSLICKTLIIQFPDCRTHNRHRCRPQAARILKLNQALFQRRNRHLGKFIRFENVLHCPCKFSFSTCLRL